MCISLEILLVVIEMIWIQVEKRIPHLYVAALVHKGRLHSEVNALSLAVSRSVFGLNKVWSHWAKLH